MNQVQTSLAVYRERYQSLLITKSLSGKEALKAVERDGDALQYVDAKWFIAKREGAAMDAASS